MGRVFVSQTPRGSLIRHQVQRQSDGPGTMGFMRGQQQGWYEAEKCIRKKYPEAAAMIRERFILNKDGSIG